MRGDQKNQQARNKMKIAFTCRLVFVCLALLLPKAVHAIEPSVVINLWPGEPPGEKVNLPEERNLTKPEDRPVAGKPVIRIGNVSKPTISLYIPAHAASG